MIDHLWVTTPDRSRVLVSNITLSLKKNGRLLIVGNSGTGKSSLLRVIAGLWNSGSGTITRPTSEEIFFLPQKPYCTLGSLRDQLVYPQVMGKGEERVRNEDLLKILAEVELGKLLGYKNLCI